MTIKLRRLESAGLALSLLISTVPSAWSQERLEEMPERFTNVMLGDWFQPDGDRTDTTYHIRLDADGTFHHGSDTTFGRYTTSWRSGRVTLAGRDALTVRWAETGPCTYYVELIEDIPYIAMIWRPYRDKRDFGPYDGIITRTVMPEGPCRQREWRRLVQPAPEKR